MRRRHACDGSGRSCVNGSRLAAYHGRAVSLAHLLLIPCAAMDRFQDIVYCGRLEIEEELQELCGNMQGDHVLHVRLTTSFANCTCIDRSCLTCVRRLQGSLLPGVGNNSLGHMLPVLSAAWIFVRNRSSREITMTSLFFYRRVYGAAVYCSYCFVLLLLVLSRVKPKCTGLELSLVVLPKSLCRIQN